MKELPRSLRATIIHQLVELLRMEDSSWETVAMVILSTVSRGSRSSEPTWGSAQALLPRGQAWPCPGIPALAFLLLSRHCAPRPLQLLECTELGDELDCVVSLFGSYLRSPCLGMQSLVLRAILGLTERPATVSGGSRQRHECRGLGWAGPGLLWLGTLPGSGEGKGRWAGWESGFAQGAVIAFPKGRRFVHTGEANTGPAAEHHGAAAGCRQRHPRCRSARAQHHAAAPGGEDAQPHGSGAGRQAPSPLWRRKAASPWLRPWDSPLWALPARFPALGAASPWAGFGQGTACSFWSAFGGSGTLPPAGPLSPSRPPQESSTVRLLSIRLFLDTLGFVEGSEEKLQQVAHRSLLPLSFHLHDQDESVAEVGILLLGGGRC